MEEKLKNVQYQKNVEVASIRGFPIKNSLQSSRKK